ncbi:MAG: sigma-70 family RNA polymerase sigma factor [Cyclobacteriaceae bacterium]|nr:sigma-70 family RNA polymerase sigma factor [Cyclobacteriaceae bacterium SS2]
MKSLDPLCQEETFNGFFQAHIKSLRNYIYYKFGDNQSANDVAQDAFVALWNNCSKVTLETARAYVYKIANNLSMSLKRHDQVKLKYNNQAVKLNQTSESPEYLMLENEFMDQLNHAISSLPDKQREVFLMNRIEKLTYREIAEIKGVSQKAIEKLMHKALHKLGNQFRNI